MPALFGFLINLVIIAILFLIFWWIVGLVASALGVPGPIVQLVRALCALLFILWLLGGSVGYLPWVFPYPLHR